jgi:hypothetical protein
MRPGPSLFQPVRLPNRTDHHQNLKGRSPGPDRLAGISPLGAANGSTSRGRRNDRQYAKKGLGRAAARSWRSATIPHHRGGEGCDWRQNSDRSLIGFAPRTAAPIARNGPCQRSWGAE